MPFWIEALVSLFLVVGSLFALIGAIGLYRLPDFYTRLHGPTKATTLGVGGIIIASMIFFSSHNDGLSMHELLITLFLFIGLILYVYYRQTGLAAPEPIDRLYPEFVWNQLPVGIAR